MYCWLFSAILASIWIKDCSLLFHQLLDCVHGTCLMAAVQGWRLGTHLFQERVLMLSLLFFGLLELRCLEFFAQNAGIIVDKVLEDRLSLVKIECHESVGIFHRHLRVECMHWSIFYQLSHAIRQVLESFCINRCIRLIWERAMPSLVHTIHSLKLIVDTSHGDLTRCPPLAQLLLLLLRRRRSLVLLRLQHWVTFARWGLGR